MNRREHLLGVLLSTATFLWAFSFMLVKDAPSDTSPAQLKALRFGVAALCFLPFVVLESYAL